MSNSTKKKKNHSQYSTFIDNENYATASAGTAPNESRKGTKHYPTDGIPSSPANKHTTRPTFNKRDSTTSLHSNYAMPPLPDANAAADLEKAKNAATSQTRSRLGTVLIRLGTACCPCLSPARVVSSTPTGGGIDWLWAFGRRLLLAVSLSRSSRSEDTRLLQRTASEEEILSKRPRLIRKSNGNSNKLEKSDSQASDRSENKENESISKSSSKMSRLGSTETAVLSPEQCEIDEEEDSICSLKSTGKGSGGKHSIDGSTGVIPKDPARKRRSRRDQAKIAKTVGKGKPGPTGAVSARFRPPHEIHRTSSASSVISRISAKSRPSMYYEKIFSFSVFLSLFSFIYLVGLLYITSNYNLNRRIGIYKIHKG